MKLELNPKDFLIVLSAQLLLSFGFVFLILG
jgi:hypothetical protein